MCADQLFHFRDNYIGVNSLGLRNELATYFLCQLTAIDYIVTHTVNRSVFYEGHYEFVSKVLTDFNVDCAMKACKRKLTTAVHHLGKKFQSVVNVEWP